MMTTVYGLGSILHGAKFIPSTGSGRSDFGTAKRWLSAVIDRRYRKAEPALLLFRFGLRGVAFLRLAFRLGVSVSGRLRALALLAFFFRDGLIDHQR